ncbi:MAG: SpaA isopeptide-forming pilin-related protein [Actinomycetaceae bacterium]|nr:SpaA isopeptide-forming pilin-related protein [Actinomycetaceae bacterium]
MKPNLVGGSVVASARGRWWLRALVGSFLLAAVVLPGAASAEEEDATGSKIVVEAVEQLNPVAEEVAPSEEVTPATKALLEESLTDAVEAPSEVEVEDFSEPSLEELDAEELPQEAVSESVKTGERQLETEVNEKACKPGVLYYVKDSGDAGRHWKGLPIPPALNDKKNVENFNALGMHVDGMAYAVSHKYSSADPNKNEHLYVYKHSPGGDWEKIHDEKDEEGHTWVAGAVDPSSGVYYFGYFSDGNTFHLHTLNGQKIEKVAIIEASRKEPISIEEMQPGSTIDNGDIAFDGNGKLYIVQGYQKYSEYWQFDVWNVDREKLQNIPGDKKIKSGNIIALEPNKNFKQINGVAFDADGRLWISARNQVIKLNLINYEIERQYKNDGYSDLASCTLPATLTVKKVLNGPRYADEQFKLSILRPNNGKIYSEGTTEGTGSDVFEDSITVPVHTDTTYKFGETIAGDDASYLADPAVYTSEWKCVDQNGIPRAQGTSLPLDEGGVEGAINIPTNIWYKGKKVVPHITCTFTNTPKVGTVSWQKRAESTSGDLLGGSKWALTPVKANNEVTGPSITVVDNDVNDSEPDLGVIKYVNLTYGRYRLEEVEAPDGFVLNKSPRFFELNDENKDFRFEESFVNMPVLGTVSWRKVDDAQPEGNLLGGSAWKYARLNQQNKPDGDWTRVEDCVVADECSESGDQDPTPGVFKLVGLAWGNYRLVEAVAPGGYLLDSKEHDFEVSEGARDYVFEKSFVNKPMPSSGSVSWLKVDDSSPTDPKKAKRLSGSVWELTGPGLGDTTTARTVTDCVKQPCPALGLDMDPDVGRFRVPDLEFGKYSLVEVQAPAGYLIPKGGHYQEFSLSGNAADIDFSGTPFVNEKREAPVLPLTGGIGRDFFSIFGAGIFVAGMIAAVALRLQKRREGVRP